MPHRRPGAGRNPRAGPGRSGHSLLRRAYWASYLPDRTLIAEQGATVRLRVRNQLRQAHSSAYTSPGVGPATVRIVPGAVGRADLQGSPHPGTCMYSPPPSHPVERVLGLHGVLRGARRRPVAPRPRRHGVRAAVAVALPGRRPEWCRRASPGERSTPSDAHRSRGTSCSTTARLPVPRASEHESKRGPTRRRSRPASPATPMCATSASRTGAGRSRTVIRLVNAGVAVHQMHFHGNHVWTVRATGTTSPATLPDAWTRRGTSSSSSGRTSSSSTRSTARTSCFRSARRPKRSPQVWAPAHGDWHYPMHCHAEMSQTAAGGLYPGGLVADWVLAGGPRAEPGAHHTFRSQVEFATSQPKEGNPETCTGSGRPDLRPGVLQPAAQVPGRGRARDLGLRERDLRSAVPGTAGPGDRGRPVHVRLKPSKAPTRSTGTGWSPTPATTASGTPRSRSAATPTSGGPSGACPATRTWGRGHVLLPLPRQHRPARADGDVRSADRRPVVHPDHPVAAGARRAFVDGPLYDVATESWSCRTRSTRAGTSSRTRQDCPVRTSGSTGSSRSTSTSSAGSSRPAGDAGPSHSPLPGTGHPTLLRILNSTTSRRIRFTASGRPVVTEAVPTTVSPSTPPTAPVRAHRCATPVTRC